MSAKPKGKPRGLRRDRDCYTCKERDVKCDLNRPACNQCVEANVQCGGYPARVIWTGVSKTPSAVRKASSSGSRSASASKSHSVTPTATTNILTEPLTTSRNFEWGVRAIVEACNHNKESAVLSRTWKFARALLNLDEGDEFQYHLLQLKAAAYEELTGCINERMLEGVFAILLFTYFDVCQGSFGTWTHHLMGARSLLDIYCPDKDGLDRECAKLPGLKHAVTLLVWYDVTGAAVHRDVPVFAPWHREIIEDQFFESVGCPGECFHTIAECLAYKPMEQQQQQQQQSSTHLHPQLKSIDAVVKLPTLQLSLSDRSANCWRFACLLVALTPLEPQTPIVVTLVDKICQTIDKIWEMEGSENYAVHLAVCVFVAGINATRLEHRNVIYNYWQHWKQVKFPLYPDALSKCEACWEQFDCHVYSTDINV